MSGVELVTAYVTLAIENADIASQVRRELASVEDQADKTGKTAGKKLGSGVKSSMGSAMAGLGGVMAGALAGIGVKNFLGDAMAEARESQKVGALTENVIKTTGGAAKVTASQVGDLASALSQKTAVDDEAIQSGANLLLTFTNVRNEVGKGNDVFNQATALANDMSAALGQDMKSSAMQLGKALNDPVKGVSALQRVGVSFTDQQKDQIKTLVESGDTMGAQKIILAELGKEFGGAAEAQATGSDRAAVAAGNLKETIGTALIPVVDKASTLFADKIAPAISAFVTGMQDGTGAGGTFRDVLEDVWNVGESVYGFLVKYKDILLPTAVGIGAVVLGVKAWTAATKVWTFITGVATGAQKLFNLAMKMNPIGIVVLAIMGLVAVLITLYKKNETVRRIIDTVWAGIKKAIRTVVDWFSETAWPTFRRIIDKVTRAFEGLKTGVGRAFDGVYSGIKSTVNSVIGFLNNSFIGGLNWILSKIPGLELRIPLIPYIGGSAKGRSTKGGQQAGFDAGGWTGPGSKYQPAGVVHADEFVIRKESQNRLRRRFPGLLDHMNRYGTLPGFARGGLVGALKAALVSITNPTAGAIVSAEQVGDLGVKLREMLGKAGSSLPAQIVIKVMGKVIDSVMSKAKEAVSAFGGPGGGGGPAWAGGGTFKSAAGSISGDIVGLKSGFLARLAAWNGALGGRYWVNSGYRSIAEQWRLWNASDRTGRMVAYPGRSRHNFGTAADLAPPTSAADRSLARRFGLYFPMSYEPWHVQPVGYARGGRVKPFVADAGVTLAPGLNVVNNKLGRPEPLARTDQPMDLSERTLRAIDSIMAARLRLDGARIADATTRRQRGAAVVMI